APKTHAEAYDPVGLLLSWQDDPSTTITLSWISDPDRTDDVVEFRKSQKATWHPATGFHLPLPEDMPYLIHHVSLTDLEANSDYVFRMGSEYRFRTLPDDSTTTFRFIVGGDMYNGNMKNFMRMNVLAASYDPMFVLVGGDIAYAHGKDPSRESPSKKMRWIKWMQAWKEQMVTPDGRQIPIIPAIGNHDVTGWFNQTPLQSPYFYTFFPMPGPQGYNVLDIANFISIIVLDSGHTHPIAETQKSWLFHVLKERRHIPHKFALYHQAAFPSVRNFDDKPCKLIRQHWVPLFERFGLATAFEHHEHYYKRTHPILNNRVDPKGIFYLGDGGWGVTNTRPGKDPHTTWYLEKTVSVAHFILVTIQGEKRLYQAINIQGQQIDEAESR
ncbi:MAG: purple acid phosphatase family protein, partial [Waddliaceae bacterium]